MNVECHLNQLRGLMQLLRTEDENNSDSEGESNTSPEQAVGPSAVKPKKSSSEEKPKEPSPYEKVEDTSSCARKNPQSWDEIEEEELENQYAQPEFKISYKQAVATEDLYLGLSNKTPSTASCEDIVLEIKVPDETVGIDGMTVDVTEKEVLFQSPKYRTKIPLPYEVDPNKGKAIYNSDHKILKLTLRMRRELDFVNF